MIRSACAGAGARSRVEPTTPAPAPPVSACARRPCHCHRTENDARSRTPRQPALPVRPGIYEDRDFFAASRSEACSSAPPPASGTDIVITPTTAHGAAAAAPARHSASCRLASLRRHRSARSIINAFLVLLVRKSWSYHLHQPVVSRSGA